VSYIYLPAFRKGKRNDENISLLSLYSTKVKSKVWLTFDRDRLLFLGERNGFGNSLQMPSLS
jgi:hypothetical protein